MEGGDLLVEVLGQDVHLLLVLAGLALVPELELGNALVGEGAGHHERGMAGSAAQVEETALSQDDDAMAVGELPAVDLGLDLDALDAGVRLEASHVDLVIEVTNVANDGVVLHLGHHVNHDDVLVTGGGDEDVPGGEDVLNGAHLVAVHAGLEGADGVDLGHDGAGTSSLHGHGGTLADVTEATDPGGLASNHHVGTTHDTVGERVTAAVHVVELGLGDGVVHVDGREQQGAGGGHLVQALNTGGGLLRHTNNVGGHLGPLLGVLGDGVTDDSENQLVLEVVGGGGVGQGLVGGVLSLVLDALVDEEGGVTTVVDDHVAARETHPVQGLLSAPPVLLQGLALPGEHGGGVASDGRSGVILGGEDVARAPADLSAELHEGLDQHSGLDGHVEGASDVAVLQGLGGAELGHAGHETGHLNLGHLDLEATEVSLSDVLDLVLIAGGSLVDGVSNGRGHLYRLYGWRWLVCGNIVGKLSQL
mmetsp:Transcript_11650/g.24377  ORF Transcript_11650/g.24377 Transcript_11650/m.24377 type:complete len:477 (-) Transcript_11650:1-1431(-)